MTLLEQLQQEKLAKEQRIIELQAMLDAIQSELDVVKIAKQISCPHCHSTLKITKYYVGVGDTRLLCPICGVFIGEGIEVVVVASPIVDTLRSDIALLDKRIDELERAIRDVREALDTVRAGG